MPEILVILAVIAAAHDMIDASGVLNAKRARAMGSGVDEPQNFGINTVSPTGKVLLSGSRRRLFRGRANHSSVEIAAEALVNVATFEGCQEL